MRFPGNRNTPYRHNGRQSRFSPVLCAVLLLLMTLVIFAGPLPHQILTAPNAALAGPPPVGASPYLADFPLTSAFNRDAIPDHNGVNRATRPPKTTNTRTPTNTPTNTPTSTNVPPTSTNSPTPAVVVCEAVTWTNLVNTTATGNSIQKTSGAPSTWDAGAASTKAILSGNGYAQVTADDNTMYKLFGLSNGDTNPSTTDVDFALNMAGGMLKVYESGLLRANVGTYVAGDVLKVAVESGVVNYYRNGVLLYTSSAQPIYPLLLDTSINSAGASITNAFICGASLGPNATSTPTIGTPSTSTPTIASTAVPTSTPTFTPTALFTQTPTGTNTLPPTSTPSTTFTSTPTATPRVCGGPYHYFDPEPGAPSNGGTVTVGDRFVLDLRINSGSHPDLTVQQAYMTYTYQLLHNASVDQIATACVPTNTVTSDPTVFEAALQNEVCDGPNPCIFRGVVINAGSMAFASLALNNCPGGCGGDFRVAQVGFCAYAPGQAIIHWQFSPPAPITRDTQIVDINSNIVSVAACYVDYVVNIALPAPTVTPTSPITPTPTTVCQAVVWANPVNVTITGNSIQKTGGVSSTWDAGASSTSAIASGNGYAQATADDTTTYKLFGLTNGDHNPSQTDVNFALYMAGGALKVYENGVLRGNVGTYAVGDVLKVAVEGGLINYYRNGSLVYTSTVYPTYPLVLDTSINSTGARISNAYICW